MAEERLRELAALVRRERGAQEVGGQKELATKAKISPRKVSDVERGVRAGHKTYDALERALHFPGGSFDAYLKGGPKPEAQPPEDHPPEASSSTSPGLPQHEWSAEARHRMITMTVREVLEFVENERVMRGEAAALIAMREIVRVREEAGAIPLPVEGH